MSQEPVTSLESVMLALGYAAGGLSLSPIFYALTEDLQNGRVPPWRIVFVRDTLTRALQLSGVEPLEPKGGP